MLRRITKYLSPLLLLFFIIGCSNDADGNVENDKTDGTWKRFTSIEDTDGDRFYKDYSVNKDMKDVQYNIANSQNELFNMKGEASLSTYYNYGFTDESKFFSVNVKPHDSSLDEWYVYFPRDEYEEFYNDLMDSDAIDVKIVGIVPSSAYKEGQGNMAGAAFVEYEY